jgi:hypothetical protein
MAGSADLNGEACATLVNRARRWLARTPGFWGLRFPEESWWVAATAM